MTPNSGSNLSVIGGAPGYPDDDPDGRPPGIAGEVIDERAPDDPYEDEGAWLSAQDILNADDIVTEVMLIPEWSKGGKPGKIVLQSLDGDHRDRYLNSIQYVDSKGRQRYDLKGANARLVAMSAIRADGQPLFKLSQVEALQAKNAAVIERIAAKVRKLSGLDNIEDEEEERNRREGLG
jgi:hypothetical protein